MIVASPPEHHADQAVACLRRGVPVLVEKPLALSLADARRVAEAARSTGTPALVGQNFRLRALERSLRATVARGVGRLSAGAIVSARPAHIGPARVGGEGHAPLWDLGVHHFDLARRRLGGPPASVTAARHGSTYRVVLTWADGREVTWWHDEQGAFHHHEWWRGERACLEVRGQRVWLAPEGRRPRPQRRPRGPGAERRLLDALAGAVAGGDDGGLAAAENLPTIATVEAAAAALDAGAPVRRPRKRGVSMRVAAIAWDAPDLEVLRTGVREGWLPNLAGLARRGTFALLDDTQEMLTASSWATLARGVPLADHGMIADTQLVPGSYRVAPLAGEAGAVPPFWAHRGRRPAHDAPVDLLGRDRRRPARHPGRRLGLARSVHDQARPAAGRTSRGARRTRPARRPAHAQARPRPARARRRGRGARLPRRDPARARPAGHGDPPSDRARSVGLPRGHAPRRPRGGAPALVPPRPEPSRPRPARRPAAARRLRDDRPRHRRRARADPRGAGRRRRRARDQRLRHGPQPLHPRADGRRAPRRRMDGRPAGGHGLARPPRRRRRRAAPGGPGHPAPPRRACAWPGRPGTSTSTTPCSSRGSTRPARAPSRCRPTARRSCGSTSPAAIPGGSSPRRTTSRSATG